MDDVFLFCIELLVNIYIFSNVLLGFVFDSVIWW